MGKFPVFSRRISHETHGKSTATARSLGATKRASRSKDAYRAAASIAVLSMAHSQHHAQSSFSCSVSAAASSSQSQTGTALALQHAHSGARTASPTRHQTSPLPSSRSDSRRPSDAASQHQILPSVEAVERGGVEANVLQMHMPFTPSNSGAAFGLQLQTVAQQPTASMSVDYGSGTAYQTVSAPAAAAVVGETWSRGQLMLSPNGIFSANQQKQLQSRQHRVLRPQAQRTFDTQRSTRHRSETSQPRDSRRDDGGKEKKFKWTQDRLALIVKEYEEVIKDHQVVTAEDDQNIATKVGSQLLQLPGPHGGRPPSASACHSAWSRMKSKRKAAAAAEKVAQVHMLPYAYPSGAAAVQDAYNGRNDHSQLQHPRWELATQPRLASGGRGRGISKGWGSDSSEGGCDDVARSRELLHMRAPNTQPPPISPGEARILHEIEINRQAIQANGEALHSCLEILQSMGGVGVPGGGARSPAAVAGSRSVSRSPLRGPGNQLQSYAAMDPRPRLRARLDRRVFDREAQHAAAAATRQEQLQQLQQQERQAHSDDDDQNAQPADPNECDYEDEDQNADQDDMRQ